MVAGLLREWGIEAHRGLAKTGVVGILKNGSSSRAIGLRADMDALPIHEQNDFEHISRYAGKMHACGHDGHTTMLLAAAQYLAKHKNFDGTIYFVFQPGEEKGAGGRVMLEKGLFEKFPMDAIFGMHNWPDLPAGTMAVPQSCELRGTVRTFSAQSTDRIEKRMLEIAKNMCTAYRARCRFEFERTYAATVNSVQEAELARQVMQEILPADQVLTQMPSMASEDFGFMLTAKAGAYVFIGQGQKHGSEGGISSCALHNPHYDFNDEIIPLGATYWVRLVQRFLNK